MNETTESTPLLVGSPDVRASYTLPPISEGLDSVQTQGVHHFHFEEPSPLNLATRTAYQLLTLLQWRLTIRYKVLNSSDIWERWDHQARLSLDLKVLEDRISSIWNDFATEHRTSKEVEDILWLQFPVNRNSHRFLRGKLIFQLLSVYFGPKVPLSG